MIIADTMLISGPQELMQCKENMHTTCIYWPKQQKSIEKEYGAKYSVLYESHCVCFLVIGPMHVLFLGIAKHTTQLWYTLNLLEFVSEGNYSG